MGKYFFVITWKGKKQQQQQNPQKHRKRYLPIQLCNCSTKKSVAFLHLYSFLGSICTTNMESQNIYFQDMLTDLTVFFFFLKGGGKPKILITYQVMEYPVHTPDDE